VGCITECKCRDEAMEIRCWQSDRRRPITLWASLILIMYLVSANNLRNNTFIIDVNLIYIYQTCLENWNTPGRQRVLSLYHVLLSQLGAYKPPLKLNANHPSVRARKEKFSVSCLSIKSCFIILNCAVITHHY
jgi:hypothetical protein